MTIVLNSKGKREKRKAELNSVEILSMWKEMDPSGKLKRGKPEVNTQISVADF